MAEERPGATPPRPLRAVCCAPAASPEWRWLVDTAPDLPVAWTFVYKRPPGPVARRLRRPDPVLVETCWRAVRQARRLDADLLVSHEAEMTFWCAVFARLTGLRARHVAYSFNYPFRPRQPRRAAMRLALRSVAEFVVYSTMERSLYGAYFGVPEGRIRFAPWRMSRPHSDGTPPPVAGAYVAAVGEFGRDYRHFAEAAARLPETPFVVVARRRSFPAGLALPPNVRLVFDLAPGAAFDVLAQATVTALPLAGDRIAAGHITLVATMLLGAPVVATASSGIADYVRDGETELTYPALDAAALAERLRRLLEDAPLRRRLAEAGRRFAEAHCSEAEAERDYRRFVAREIERLSRSYLP